MGEKRKQLLVLHLMELSGKNRKRESLNSIMMHLLGRQGNLSWVSSYAMNMEILFWLEKESMWLKEAQL